MKLKGWETTSRNVEIEVEPMKMVSALKSCVFEKLEIPSDAYIDNQGRLVYDIEHHTSHSWFETVVLFEKPSKEQLHAIQTFSDLYDLVQKATVKARA